MILSERKRKLSYPIRKLSVSRDGRTADAGRKEGDSSTFEELLWPRYRFGGVDPLPRTRVTISGLLLPPLRI